MLRAKKIQALQLCIAFAFLAFAVAASAQSGSGLLTNAADVLSLSTEQAALGFGVLVKGVVTAAEPIWEGQFYVQDASGGIFVSNLGGQSPEIGDFVEVAGISSPGPFAPIITQSSWKKLGTAPLPAAKPVPIEQLIAGVEACQRVEITGSVRAVRVEASRLVVDLVSGGYRIHVIARIPPGIDPQTLVAAKVRVRGTAVTKYNASLHQLITVNIYVPAPGDFIVETAEFHNPFNEPIIPLNSIAQYRRDNFPGKRVHVKGVVTLQRPREDFFLQDTSGGLQIKSSQLGSLAPGDVVEAVGFAEVENFLPVLQDAVFRVTTEPRQALTPQPTSLKAVHSGLHHASLISLSGKLIDRMIRRASPRSPEHLRTRTTLMLEQTNSLFTAVIEEPGDGANLASIPIGGIIEVSGVCVTESADDGKIKSLQILLPTSKSVRVLQKPDWLTPGRLLVGVGILLTVLVLILAWTLVLSKKNSVLNFLILEREKAQKELQHAHDQLEERVKERTAELKFQITSRKESEVQFKAVLAERTRLAQELHDTLEQTLTGIALQLDTASKLFERNPDSAIHHLELARSLMGQSQVELRRSVWDLRCRALEQFDLPGALLRSAHQITYGTSIRVEAETFGDERTLPEVIEENLLRIGQEALTNVIKHSGARLIKIELEFGPQNVVLQIKDDGKGFTPENSAGPANGHFGLLGMSERAKRLGGKVLLVSAPGMGTTVGVEIPTMPARELQLPEPAEPQLQL
ncbi:MAG: hypothetical protein JWR26_4365 [Pedosphaera sp.]|nr:hypothetical protein [Pedosphaera sp.]